MYELSRRPDVTENIPLPLSAQGERARAYSSDKRFDIVVNGMGFNLWADASHPYRRGAEQVQKDQFDNSKEAGEQTLGGAWIRSQTSWHMGAGIDFYEPGAEPDTQFRFKSSHGVDVWTEGEASLLPAYATVGAAVTGTGRATHLRLSGVDSYVVGDTTSQRRYSAANALQATVATAPTMGPVAGGVAGRTYHATAGTVGYIDWSAGSPSSTTIRTTGTAPTALAVVKHRLMVAAGRTLYWVADALPSGPIGSTNGDLTVHIHPSTSWSYTNISESPDAILAAGNDGVTSRIYSVAVTSADVPEFDAPVEVLQLPPGEIIRSMRTYLGTYIVLATSAGIRVGLLGQAGQVQIGPLTVDRPAQSVAFHDRFAYVSVSTGLEDGTTGVIRVDLSAPVGESDLYAWACDVTSGATGAASSVVALPDGSLVLLAGAGVFRPSGSKVTNGWLETGRIRFATTEKKDFQRIALVGELNTGSIDIDAIVGATTQRVVSYDPNTGTGVETEIRVGSTSLFQEMAFRVTLNRVGSAGPTVLSLAVKAEPAVAKQRLYDIPLVCADFETNREGLEIGYNTPGSGAFGIDRLLELEELDARNEPLVVEDNRTGEAFVGTIVSVEFTALHNPDRMHKNADGWISLTVRKR